MFSHEKYIQILRFLDRNLWDTKTDESNWNYNGLILDYYFYDSVLSIDYLDLNEFFYENGKFEFVDTINLEEQYGQLKKVKGLKLIENILNILKHSHINKEQCDTCIQKISNALKRTNIEVVIPEHGYISLRQNDIIDSGSYCNIRKISDGILRKELNSHYSSDEKLKKRMKYEFENMTKLKECPQILKVFDYDDNSNTYLMEQADTNLYDYLNNELILEFETKCKITTDILAGMAYAHSKDVIHRDLHLGNVLKINNDFVICDFGLSKDLSIERSMKSSATPKNNHLFVDPLVINDFTKADKSSDIFSIGKIIDYVFLHNHDSNEHLFKSVVERCTSRNKSLRYSSCNEILEEISSILNKSDSKEHRTATIDKIKSTAMDNSVQELVLEFIENDSLSKFIVYNNLNNFGKLILKFEYIYQVEILKSINSNFAEATGYGGWSNYDIFANIAYFVCNNTVDESVFDLAENILEECARIRYSAKDLYDTIQLNKNFSR